MKFSRFVRTLVFLVVTVFAVQVAAQSVPPANNDNGEQMQPKFIWGILVNIALNMGTSIFMNWLVGKLTSDLTPVSLNKMNLNGSTASIIPISTILQVFGMKSAGAPENAVAGEVSAPIQVNNGRENYQAVHVALIGFNREGAALGFRPVTSGFRTGERFKLRVLPTFDGLLVIDNINPKKERRQIYPAQADQVVRIKAGVEILIPLDRDQYFEFTGATGDEQLVITLRDPRAFGAMASTAQVLRKDEHNGSNFMQEVTASTFPLISQGLRLRHD